jgi:hypothetical protein
MVIRGVGGRIVDIMRRTVLIFPLVLTLSLLSASLSHAQVQTRLRVFEASNVGTGIDSSLRDMGDQFKSLFSFSSYRLLKEEMLTLRPNQTVSIPIPPKREIELTLTGKQRNFAEVRVRIKQEQTDILNTQVRLFPGKTVSIGGPKHGEGVMIVTLSAQF